MNQELSPEQLDRLERAGEALNAALAKLGEPPATVEELRALVDSASPCDKRTDVAEAMAGERRCPHCGSALP